MSLEPGRRLSHYRILLKLGEGGMGVVYKALDENLDRLVAIKVLRADLLEDANRRHRFEREARLTAAINHPNVATIHEVGEADGITFIVMEYIEGETLRSRLRGRSLRIESALKIAAQIADGLARAHQMKIIHRDLKPENVLIDADGRPKLLDFGLARLLDEEGPGPGAGGSGRGGGGAGGPAGGEPDTLETMSNRLTREGRIVGTVAYMSPEQAAAGPLDSRSDIFAFGIVLYEMITGCLPFTGQTHVDILRAILREPATPASRLTPEAPALLEPILSKCLEKEPALRYQDTRDLAVDLNRLVRDVESGSWPSYKDLAAGPLRGGAGWSRGRRLFAIGGIGALCLAVLATGLWLVTRRSGAAIDPETVLVLPLTVRGQDEGGSYVGQAFAQTIAVNLAQSRVLRVLPVPDSPPGGATDAVASALAAHAGRVLTGTLTRDGASMQASVSLLDSAGNRIIWGDQKDGSRTDLAGLATEFAREAAGQLGLSPEKLYDYPLYLSGDPAMVTSPEAVQALEGWRNNDIKQSIAACDRLVAAYPTEVAAHALRLFILNQNPTPLGALQRALDAIDRVDPNNPYSAYFRIALAKPQEPRDVILRKNDALLARNDLRPGCRAWILRNRANAAIGQQGGGYWHFLADEPVVSGEERTELQDGAKNLNEAIQLDPSNAWGHLYLGWTLARLGSTDEALGYAGHAAALEPSFDIVQISIGLITGMTGRWDESVAAFDRALELRKSQMIQALRAVSLKKAGREKEALEAARAAERMPPDIAGTYSLARFWALNGAKGDALRELRAAASLGLSADLIEKATDLAPLRGLPEFKDIVHQAGTK